LIAAVEERLLIPTYTSRWGSAPVVAHRGMALPFQLIGDVRRRRLKAGGEPLDIVEVGREKLLRPIATKLFGELPRALPQKQRALWSPAAVSQGSNHDLVLAEVHRWMAPRFRRAGWIIIPQSVRWQGELSQIPPRNSSHGLRENLRKMRRQGYALELVTSPEGWNEFYETMVGPQALARHGSTAWIPSRQTMDEFSRVGLLHLITRNGEKVAGFCMVPNGDMLWLAVSGVRQGDPALFRQGAGFAIMALTAEWAREHGYRILDAGRTGPFIQNGLQQYKRSWGFTPVPDPLSHLVAVWVGSNRVREAFSQQPVLTENGTELRVYPGE